MSNFAIFNNKWLDLTAFPEFSDWVVKVEGNKNAAYCKICRKHLSLANTGAKCLRSHMKSKGHSEYSKVKVSQPSIASFGVQAKQNSSINTESQETATSAASVKSSTATMESFVVKEDTLKAEILWCLKIVKSKMSLNSCSDLNFIFRTMFADSEVGKKFKLGSTKCSYFINYGLAPFFKDNLLERVKKCDEFVICFDESLNKVVQRGQMDLFVRYFDTEQKKVITQYLNSAFLNHAKATDLLNKFSEALAPLSKESCLQVSMDGPNVNLSFVKKLSDEKKEKHPGGRQLIDIGVCGLHVVNGAVKTGLNKVKWELHNFLRDVSYVFNDSPARRADYTEKTQSKIFPLKHCTVRWVENIACLERALAIFDDVKKFMNEGNLPSTKPIENVKKAVNDPMMKPKLAFFKTICGHCEAFLRRFQSQKPLAPYLHGCLMDLVKTLMTKFIKTSKLESIGSVRKLSEINVDIDENLLPVSKIDVGFTTKKLLKDLNVKDVETNTFKINCRTVLQAITKKLLERSPLKYRLVRGITCLDPNLIMANTTASISRMDIVLEVFHDSNHINDTVAEKAKVQYRSMVHAMNAKTLMSNTVEAFLDKPQDEMGLDELYYDLIGKSPNYIELWKVVKLCLVLSHGNAAVEGGFSINKSLLVENLHEQSLVAQRQVEDALAYFGGIEKINISKSMRDFVKGSNKRYEMDLNSKRQRDESVTLQHEKKRKIEIDLKNLEEERKLMLIKKQLEEEKLASQIEELKRKKEML